MSAEWLTTQQVAERLGCSVETVRAMLRSELLSGEKVKGQWRVKAAEVKKPWPVKTPPLPEVDPGMVEISMALASIAAAIATILPGIPGVPETLRLSTAILADIVAVFSAYSALWLLARYCLAGESAAGFSEICALLLSPGKVGPYWPVALGLLVWLMLSFLIGVLAVMR